jgi:DNA-3-methyladenine glycosylase II
MNKNFSKAEKSLIESDPKLGKVIKNNGHLQFSIKKIDPFNELVNIVISQFISTKAAKGIKEKMLKQLNEESFKILSFKNLTVNQIKSLGLSKNKAKSIKSLVLFFSQNPNSKNLYRLSEEERYDKLIKIFGIGKWSIEMFEMFCVRNKNIFSSGDAAIRVAMEELRMVKKTSDFEKYDKYAKKWDPYKTIACLHLWHFIES